MSFAGRSRSKVPLVEFAGPPAIPPTLRKNVLERVLNHFSSSLAAFTSGPKAAEP